MALGYDFSLAGSASSGASQSGATEVGGGFGIGQRGAGSVTFDYSQNKDVPWGTLAIVAAIVVIAWLFLGRKG